MSISNLFQENDYSIHVGDLSIKNVQNDNALIQFLVRDPTTGLLKFKNNVTSGMINSNGYLELPLGITFALTNPMPNFINITNGGAGFNLIMPPMNATNSLKVSPLGFFFIWKNHGGSQITNIRNNSNTTTLATLRPRQLWLGQVTDNSTSDGAFVFTNVTPVVSASSPLVLDSNTGNLSISNPFTLDGTVAFGGPITVPRTYDYSISARLNALASFNLSQFSPPNNTDNQTVLCILNGSFYNNTTEETASVRQIRVYRYKPGGPTMVLTFTSEEVISRPLGTNYYCQSGPGGGGNTVDIVAQPNNADPTDVLIHIQFLVRI